MGLRFYDFWFLDMETVFRWREKYIAETNDEDMKSMSIQGIDPMKIPYYKNYVRDKDTKPSIKISPETKKEYKGIFKNFLRQDKK